MWKILRANMSTLSVKEEPYPDDYMGLGGRSLIARVMTDEVDPACGPLGPGNKLLLHRAFAGAVYREPPLRRLQEPSPAGSEANRRHHRDSWPATVCG